MYFALAKLLGSVPGLNTRSLTEADFYRICRRERIKVVEMPLLVPGFYMLCKGRRFIVIDSRVRGVRWLHVAWHELAHHFLHAPKRAASVSFFQVREESKVLFEAEAFAAIALIPEPMLRSMLAGEIEDEHGYTREMVEFRLKVLELYGV
jgi:Zn-dependent peptidase ImmA (M78 family)